MAGTWGTPPPVQVRMEYPPTRSGWGTPQTCDEVPPLDLGQGTPPLDLGQGTPPDLGQGTLPPDLGWGTPPTWDIASTCYAAGGMPLAFTQEDFLVEFEFDPCEHPFRIFFAVVKC